MKDLPIPIALLEVGKPLPVDVWSSTGQLLLRRAQPIVSQQHRDKLHAFNACTTLADGLAWQVAYERMVQAMIAQGADLRELTAASMPTEILESDYAGEPPIGGWLDLQELLRGMLYQGGLAINPLPRLKGMEVKVLDLLQRDSQGSLFALFQALGDKRLGYCATHALLCAVVCELTAAKLGLPGPQRKPLIAAALTMNIGMAREQDAMARQSTSINDWQRTLVAEHAARGEEILRAFGLDDPLQLDLVRWHHLPDAPKGLPDNLTGRKLLHLADVFVARVAARRTRAALSPVSAVKTMVFGGGGDLGMGSAMAQAVGFYPPGSYVRLVSGEVAVAVQRGERANTPWVISIAGSDGAPFNIYQCKSTAEPRNAIAAALDFEKVKVAVDAHKMQRARERIAPARRPA